MTRSARCYQGQGVLAVLVRPRYPVQIEVQRDVRWLLAASDRDPAAGPGVTGELGTIKWSDGATQAS